MDGGWSQADKEQTVRVRNVRLNDATFLTAPAGTPKTNPAKLCKAQRAAMQKCLDDAFRLVLSLEGTISGEHGVGLEKRDYVGWEIAADTLAVMREVKRAFDPKGILNPGKCLPGI